MPTSAGQRIPPDSRILVIAEDEQARGLLTSVLRADGHAVDAAADRTEAMALIDQHPYAVALSNLRMRDSRGPSWCGG